MRKIVKRILIIILILFILLQFYPKSAKNQSDQVKTSDITLVHTVPTEVMKILKTSCYDCHSNNTIYPWYSKVQPVSLWLDNHIKEGKSELNFSEFGSYSLRKQYRKLEEINGQVKSGEMPLSSYTLIHRYAILNADQKSLIANWITALRDSFMTNYPADSLRAKNRRS